MTTNTGNTASLLLRLSSQSDDDNTGLRSQEKDLRDLAARMGLDVVAVHTDDGLSGALRDRPGLLGWLADGREGNASHLLAWSLDRVTRGGSTALAVLLDLLEGIGDDGKALGIVPPRFLTVRDGIDSASPAWRLQAVVLAEVAKAERDAIRARVLRHRETARAEGRIVGGRRPWAFTTAARDGGGLRFVPVPEHAEAIRAALVILRAGGSLGDVVRDWTERGLSPKDGGEWHVSPVRRILANPNLAGAQQHRGALLRNDDGTLRLDAGQAILTLAEHAEMTRLLDGRSTSRSANHEDTALLSGVLLCSTCRRTLYPHRPAGGRVATYRCRGGQACSQPVSVLMETIEEHLLGIFAETLAPEQATTVEEQPAAVDAAEVARLAEALAEVERIIAEDADEEQTLAALRQRRDLRARLAAEQDKAETTALRTLHSAETYGERLAAAATPQERNDVLRAAFDAVLVAPGARGGRIPLAERVEVVTFA